MDLEVAPPAFETGADPPRTGSAVPALGRGALWPALYRAAARPATEWAIRRLSSGQPGRVAQWESARFTRERSVVRNHPRPSHRPAVFGDGAEAAESRKSAVCPCLPNPDRGFSSGTWHLPARIAPATASRLTGGDGPTSSGSAAGSTSRCSRRRGFPTTGHPACGRGQDTWERRTGALTARDSP
jgi:hypothetical protein